MRVAALVAGRDDDLEFGAAVDVVDFHQFHQAGRLAGVVLDDETPLVLVVQVAVIEGDQFVVGLVRLFEPITHDDVVIVDLVDEVQVAALQGAYFDIGYYRHRNLRKCRHCS
ncbi:hypothetical protein MyNCGM683_20910 [Achromobacter xylosoxidans]